jgi:hypothetical protein
MLALVAALGLMLQTNASPLPHPTVDATTLHKKVLCGYQGWFRATGDGGTEWDHWNRGWRMRHLHRRFCALAGSTES